MFYKITKTDTCSSSRQLDYIPNIFPDEFLGWYEYRIKKLNFLDYKNNMFFHGKWVYTLPFNIEPNNIFSQISISYLNTLLMRHTILSDFIDEGSLRYLLYIFEKVSSDQPCKLTSPETKLKSLSKRRDVACETSNFLYKSTVKYCPSCFVDQTKSHGIPWLKLSWFKNVKSCEIHGIKLVEPYCHNCDEILVKHVMFDSLLTGSCSVCDTILWGVQDCRPISSTTEQHIEKLGVQFLVDNSVNMMLSEYFRKLYNEVHSLTENFTKHVELSELESFALHCREYNHQHVLKRLFNGNWNEFIAFFCLETIWKPFPIGSGRSLNVKMLVKKSTSKNQNKLIRFSNGGKNKSTK